MRVVFLSSPTASGKSDWAVECAALRKNVAIVNCDSVQVYQDLLVGSASPTEVQKSLAPHHLYNYLSYPNVIGAGDFRRSFFETLKQLESHTDLVLAVGGAGFYLRSLIQGMYETTPSGGELRDSLEAKVREGHSKDLFEELMKFDPESAKTIHPNDSYRLVRALEILKSTGVKPSELKKQANERSLQFPYPFLNIIVEANKDMLAPRVFKRVKSMLDQGLIEEVAEQIRLGRESWAPLGAVGYTEVRKALLNDEVHRDDLLQEIHQSTMSLIKKQKTWFQTKTRWEDRVLRRVWTENRAEMVQFLTEKIDQFVSCPD